MVVRRQHIDVQVHTQADAGTVYALLRDGASWPTWSPIDSFELERTGAQEAEGIGAILLRWGIERFIRKCARGLAAHAATRSAPHR